MIKTFTLLEIKRERLNFKMGGMMRRICIILFSLQILVGEALAHQIGECDSVLPPNGAKVDPTGTIDAIVLIASCSHHRTIWESRNDYQGRTWPQMPLWMCDSLIAPNESSIEGNPNLKWSISNFMYRESRQQHILISDKWDEASAQWNSDGIPDVNPGKNGEFFCSDVDYNFIPVGTDPHAFAYNPTSLFKYIYCANRGNSTVYVITSFSVGRVWVKGSKGPG